MSFHCPALLRRARRPGHSGAAAPDSAREEADRPLPVADVRAAHPVPVGPAPAHPQLAAAAGAARGAGAHHPGVRAAVLRAPGRCRRRAPARAKWSSCSTRATAWATATAGSARGRRRTTRSTGSAPADRGSVVLFSSGAEIALRSTAAGERERLTAAVAAAKPTRRRHALRAGAEGGGQHPGGIAAAAARGGAHQRLPARRLARRGRRAAAGGRDGDAGADRRHDGRAERVGDGGVARALDVLEPGARGGDRGRRQSQHAVAQRRPAGARDRRASGADASRSTSKPPAPRR